MQSDDFRTASVSRRRLLVRTALALAMPASARAGTPAFREISWDDLMPKDWDPMKEMNGRIAGIVSDGDPRALKLQQDMRRIWDSAPTVPALDGASVKLPGYVVPLEEAKGGLREFLLVPYFGACIHVPPPPANQIVLVVPKEAVKGFRTMDTVWVSGTLQSARSASAMGASGYRMTAAIVEPYVTPQRGNTR